MATPAKLNYPEQNDQEETSVHPEESPKTDHDESASGYESETESKQKDKAQGASGDKPAPFEIPGEDFCADAYEVEGHAETRQALGKRGEEAAVRYLEAKGYEILKRNWYCRFGEADIIARDIDGTICFIEVKTRRSIEAGIPEESITRDKRRRYERIALC